eukprot:scaffold186898_cov28-Tisochrysis_lutea.AAC.1
MYEQARRANIQTSKNTPSGPEASNKCGQSTRPVRAPVVLFSFGVTLRSPRVPALMEAKS